MKKVLLVLIVLLIALGGIFHKQIIATIDFYQYQRENADVFSQATIKWKPIPFTSTGESGVTGDSLSFHSLRMPITFRATKGEGEDASFAFGGAQSITINYSSAASDLFRMYNFSDEDKKTTCAFLSQTSGRGACTSNYNLYRAFLELNKTDIHIFTSITNKQLYNRLMEIRAGHIPSNTVSGFETSGLRGFIFTDNSGDYTVELFDSEDQQYHLELVNLDLAEMSFVLSNITYNK
ncbi:hypothetical protein KC865_04875 [Candidatus Kaiserbacteria bacterium]|nr:hypothetical protein [Candidatus Kaiserbacteria bacterium]USN92453.1 MAG: hypothetical protein H6782_01405 [Candidatus Nomurabacteria bacterium]